MVNVFKDKDVVMLQNVCNRLKAENRELREQIREKSIKQAEIDGKLKSEVEYFRELCKMILAKDKREMVLGKEYSWDELSNKEICEKTIDSYIFFEKERTEAIKMILNKFEKQGEELDGLKLQHERLLNREKASASENDEKSADKFENNDGTLVIIEEDSDIIDGEIKNSEAEINTNIAYQLTPSAPKVIPAPKKVKAKEKMGREFIERDMYKVKDIVDKLNVITWLIIEVLGVVGCSLRKDIIDTCLKFAAKRNLNTNYSALARELNKLTNIPDVITVEKIKLPDSGYVYIIQLDRVGRAIFENRFDKRPVKSEAKIIQEEHDNLTHGYSIVSLGQSLLHTDRFKKVSVMNKKHAIGVTVDNQKTVYVPDLICVDKNGETIFYEYELANHNMRNFRFKCNKMVQVMSSLRFVVPNKAIAERLKTKINNWISETGTYRLKNTKVLVYTYKSVIDDNPPILEYDLSVSEAPVVDKT